MDPEETKAAKASKSGDKKKLQISEMDEWMESDDMDSSEDEDEEKKKNEDDDSDNDSKSKQKKAKGKVQNQKKKKKVNDEAFEVRFKRHSTISVISIYIQFKDSDDGDEEGRERDYISDSSDR